MRDRAGFMSANLDEVQRAVEALPWVDQRGAWGRAAWPNSLHITGGGADGSRALGRVGTAQHARRAVRRAPPRHVPAELPRLSGPGGHRGAGGAALSVGAGPACWRPACASPHCGWMSAARGRWTWTAASPCVSGAAMSRSASTASSARPRQVISHRYPRDQLRRHALFERLRHRLAPGRRPASRAAHLRKTTRMALIDVPN